MSSTPTQLLVRKKITAIYADGSAKMNLGIATVVRMLKGTTNVPVEVAADAAARILLAELARSAGRTVERASAGLFLAPPVVQSGVDQRVSPAVPLVSDVPAGPKPRRTRGNGKVKPRAVRKYPALSTTFLQGSLSGQIKSVFKSRETNAQKVADFKLALANGDCTWDLLPLSKSLLAKLQTLGIEVPATRAAVAANLATIATQILGASDYSGAGVETGASGFAGSAPLVRKKVEPPAQQPGAFA